MKLFAPIGPSRALPLLVPAALLCLIPNFGCAEEADAKMYECNQGGVVTFSDQPCAGQERKIDIQYEQPGQTQVQEAQAAAQQRDDQAGAVAEADLLNTEILNIQQEISRLQTERFARMAEMKKQIQGGTESLDKDAWLAQQRAQMESVYQDYTARIIDANSHLNDLQARLAALGGPVPGSVPQ
jgi:hypothetical protein